MMSPIATRRAALLATVFVAALPGAAFASDTVISNQRKVSGSTGTNGTIVVSGTDTVTVTSTGTLGGANSTESPTPNSGSLINITGGTTSTGVIITNSGTILNGGGGGAPNNGGNAIVLTNASGIASTFKIVNNANASITAVRSTILIGSQNAAPAASVSRDPSSTMIIDNSGTITSTNNTIDGTINTYLANKDATTGPSITLFNRAGGIVQGARDAIKAGTMTIDNAGQILGGSASGSDAIDVRGNDATGTIVNRNGGLIQGEHAILGGGGTTGRDSGGNPLAGGTTFDTAGGGTLYQSTVRQLIVTNQAGGTIRGTASYAIGGPSGVNIDNAGVIESTGAANTAAAISVSGLPSVNAITGSVITVRSTGRVTGASQDAIILNSDSNTDDVVNLEAGATIQGRINMGTGSNDVVNLSVASGGPTVGALPELVGVESVNVTAGDWTLATTSSSTPLTTIGAGAIFRIGSGGASGGFAGGSYVDNGLLVYNRSDATAQAAGDAITGIGGLQVAGGVFTLNGANTYSGATNVSGGTLAAGAANSFSANSALTVAAGATADLGGFNQSVAGLSGAGNVALGAGTLTDAAATDSTFSGVASGTGGLTKTGAGTQTLSGANSYTGVTAVAGGQLALTGAVAGEVSVAGGATFSGTGSVAGTVTVADSGHIAPGSGGVGTLTLGGLVLSNNSQLDMDLGRPNRAAGDGSDYISVNGALTLDGILNIANAGGLAPGVYHIIGYSGALTDNLLTVGGVPAGLNASDFTVQTSEAGFINIVSNASGGSGPPPAMQFWDSGNPANFNNDQVNGGSGTWQAGGTSNWTSADGSLNNTWGGGTAIFQGTAGNVTVAGAVDTAGMQFLTNNYVVAGQTGAQINLTGAATGIRTDTGVTTTISAVLGGIGGLSKQGDGNLILSGVNSYAGATNIAGGTLTVQGGQAITDTSIVTIASAGTLALGASETIGGLAGSGAVALGGNTLTVAAATDGTFAGTIGGTGGLTKTGVGVLTLSGADTYSGATTLTGGKLVSGADGAFGTGALSLAAGTMADLAGHANSFAALSGSGTLALGAGVAPIGGGNSSTSFGGTISGSGSLIKTGTGTLTLAGANTYTGATTVTAGTLAAGAAGAIGTGALTVATGANVNLAGFATSIGSLSGGGGLALGSASLTVGSNNASTSYSGVISGTGSLTKVGTGTLTLSGVNTYTGATMVNAGTLAAGAAGAIGTGALTIATGATVNLAGFATSIASLSGSGKLTLGSAAVTVGSDNSSTSFAGAISGTGSLTKTGTDTLTLSGANTYTGQTTVNSGVLVNNGSLTSVVTVGANGRLGGNGSYTGAVFGGTVAPGNSIGTVTVNGNATFQANSIYEVELNQAGASDLIKVTGTTTIQGGTVRVLAASETATSRYANIGDYTILTSGGALTGTFSSVTSNMAFLTPSLLYGGNNVVLRLSRNDVTFAQIAQTPNQVAVASAIDGTHGAGPLYTAVLPLSAADARTAFSTLSGEFYATAPVALFQEAGDVRRATLDRLGEIGDAEGTAIWFKYLAVRADQDGTANNSALRRASNGYIGGIDRSFGKVRAGLSVGSVSSDLTSAASGSRGDAQSTYLSGYAGREWGAFSLRGGASYAWHSLDANRSIAFGSFTDATSVRLKGETLQAFAEAGYTVAVGVLQAQPFVGAGWQRTTLRGGTETGGAAALTLNGREDVDTPFVSVGVRAKATFGDALHIYGSVADRFERNRDTTRTVAFSNPSAPFTITGVGTKSNNLTYGAGVSLDIGKGVVGVSYNGESARGYRDDAVRLTAGWRF